MNYPRSFRHREQLPFTPNSLWKIESGYARTMTWNAEGAIAALGIWGTGDVIGHCLSNIEPYQIECLGPVVAREVAISNNCTRLLLSHIQQIEQLLNLANIQQASARLIGLLEWLAQRFGRLESHGYLIDIPLTHQSIAELIGTTRVTVTRTLSELERAGKIQRLRQHRILLQSCERSDLAMRK
ncbi:Crp/Fnr family transcriptional regulator [Leptolyngbya sp. AN03gr2]|uniref:Crp/Fnr family transcriptional regulator n=1 Tax=unclassified Leptolyngbya TaxID=2650499 RepID=UPI003D322729